MAVTIKDIAAATKISSSTISRVLSGRGYVDEKTRLKVERAVSEMGYIYKPTTTKRNSIDMAMIVMGHTSSAVYDENIAGIGSIFDALNVFWVGTYGSNFNTEMQESYIMRAIRNHFKGIIILSPIETPTFIKIMNNCSIPFVTMNRPLDYVRSDEICMDNKAAGRMAVDYLVQKGHRRISFVGVANSASTDYRKKGFLEGMAKNGLPVNENDIMLVWDNLETSANVGSLIAVAKKDTTAIYAANETLANGLIDGLRKCGKSVPNDISIMATDNTNLGRLCTPKLTTVRCNHYNMGAEAAKLFMERVMNPSGEKRQIYFEPDIIERESVAENMKIL